MGRMMRIGVALVVIGAVAACRSRSGNPHVDALPSVEDHPPRA